MEPFDFLFSIFPVLWLLMFLLIMGVSAYGIGRVIAQKKKNDRAPRLTVDATVVAKRHDVSRHRSRGAGNNHSHYHTSNTYFVTFQFPGGDRMELQLQGHEFGLLVEGDKGKLTFQGTRYLGFERQ